MGQQLVKDRWEERFQAWKMQKKIKNEQAKSSEQNKKTISNYEKKIKEELEFIKKEDIRDVQDEMGERKNAVLWILVFILALFIILTLFDIRNINPSWIISIILLIIALILVWFISKK